MLDSVNGEDDFAKLRFPHNTGSYAALVFIDLNMHAGVSLPHGGRVALSCALVENNNGYSIGTTAIHLTAVQVGTVTTQ